MLPPPSETAGSGRVAAARLDPTQAAGRVLYLPSRAQLVVPYDQDVDAHTWRCVVVTNEAAHPGTVQVTIADAEIAAAVAVPLGYPARDDVYAAIWQGCTYLRWPTGYMRQLVDQLATSVRRPETVTVDLDRRAMHRLQMTIGLPAEGLRRLLDDLAAEGLLGIVEPGAEDRWGVYTLTMPPRPATVQPSREPGS
ncbi:hypothetical protein WEI85_00125 [Actinomycetes bacterium KLBMP 9797]